MVNVLNGIYAAAITPFDTKTARPDYDQFESLLGYLAERGCHGVLAAGTTGEGPSLSVDERISLFAAVQRSNTNLRLLAGTGAASLEDTKTLTRAAFDYGAFATVVIPPFFYSNPPVEGLLEYYRQVLRIMPSDGQLLLYHNPVVGAPPLDFELIAQLRDEYPHQVMGIKDSGQNWEYTQSLLEQMPEFGVFVGTDRHLSEALESGAAGAITALAGIFPYLLRDVFELNTHQKSLDSAQERVNKAHQQFDGLPRIAAFKWFATNAHIITSSAVRPPLRPLTDGEIHILSNRFNPQIEVSDLLDLADLPDLDQTL